MLSKRVHVPEKDRSGIHERVSMFSGKMEGYVLAETGKMLCRQRCGVTGNDSKKAAKAVGEYTDLRKSSRA